MIGVGIVTYDREKKFSEAYDAIDYSLIDKTFHVKDGGKPPYSDSERYENLWELDENKGVGFCKNLIIDNFEYIYILSCKRAILSSILGFESFFGHRLLLNT